MAKSSRRMLILFIAFVCFCAPAIGLNVEPPTNPKIRWPKGQIIVSLSTNFLQSSNSVKPGSVVVSALARAMSHWEAVANIEFELRYSDVTAVNSTGTAGDGISLITIDATPTNLLVFAKENVKSSAVTRLFFNKKNEIAEADIVLNPTFQFSTDGSAGTFDLERVFTHELGHLLGLHHSIVMSSAMFPEVPSNSENGLSASSVHLASDDIGGVRALYGPHIEDSNCCNVLNGSLQGVGNQRGSVVLVDRTTGSVVRSVVTSGNGEFDVSGLSHGAYDAWYSPNSNVNDMIADQKIGSVIVGKQRSKPLQSTVTLRPTSFEISLVGSNGVLSRQPIRVNRGEINRVWVAGRGLSASDLTFGLSSPAMSVNSVTRIYNEFAGELEVYAVEIEVADNVPQGSYNLYVQSGSGLRKHLFGAFWVE